MKIQFLLVILLTTSSLTAQIPEQAEDISPLLIGETLPETKLLNTAGVEVDLQRVLKQKPSVLVFYRGGWCPYCNRQLAALSEVESEIIELGYQIIAISPDHFEMLKSTEESNNVKYQLYADIDAKFIQALGIGFETPEKAKGYIFKKTNKEATDVLPVPTVMIVDTKGKILFEYINPDYSTRISPELLMANIEVLKSEM